LVVEDDPSISLGLRMNLEAEGYEVAVAEDGETGLERVREGWDLLILDVMLPRLNGYEIMGALRATQDKTPVLMLSARTAELDKVMGLELGADDYVTKPFGVAELLARVRAALRRNRKRGEEAAHAAARAPVDAQPSTTGADYAQPFRFGDVEIDLHKREVLKAGSVVDLTAKEFDVLLTLARARGGVMSRKQIFDIVWGPKHHGTTRTIDNFLAQLRAKLEDDPAAPKHLVTVRGVGYRLDS